MDKQIIGRTTLIALNGLKNIPAKVDSGAETSSVWVSSLKKEGDKISFVLFAPESPFYTGEPVATEISREVEVSSSSGHRQARYCAMLQVSVAGKTIQAEFTLTDRKTLAYPVLIGCNIVNNHFLIDVSQAIPEELQIQLKHEKLSRISKLKDHQENEGTL